MFSFRKKRYENPEPGADPQVGEREQEGNHGSKTPLGDNKPTPPLSTLNPGANVPGDGPSTNVSPKEKNES